MKLFLGVFLLLVLSVVEAVVIQVEDLPERCDFRKCTAPDPSKLNVHLVPHTHDDVGWLKTVDEYFFGLNVSIQNAGVQYILDSVVSELIKNKERRFIYVETAFFWKWWRLQSEHQREIVKELVKTGKEIFIYCSPLTFSRFVLPRSAGVHRRRLEHERRGHFSLLSHRRPDDLGPPPLAGHLWSLWCP